MVLVTNAHASPSLKKNLVWIPEQKKQITINFDTYVGMARLNMHGCEVETDKCRHGLLL